MKLLHPMMEIEDSLTGSRFEWPSLVRKHPHKSSLSKVRSRRDTGISRREIGMCGLWDPPCHPENVTDVTPGSERRLESKATVA